jgi:hypothetical protein
MVDELREEHPEQKELSDQEILDQFDISDISDIKYVTIWDNIGDAQEQFEKVADRMLEQEEDIKRLRGLLRRAVPLPEENERLRGLLRESQDYVEAGISSVDTELCDRIAKELGDE